MWATLGAGATVTVEARQVADTYANRTVVPQLYGAALAPKPGKLPALRG